MCGGVCLCVLFVCVSLIYAIPQLMQAFTGKDESEHAQDKESEQHSDVASHKPTALVDRVSDASDAQDASMKCNNCGQIYPNKKMWAHMQNCSRFAEPVVGTCKAKLGPTYTKPKSRSSTMSKKDDTKTTMEDLPRCKESGQTSQKFSEIRSKFETPEGNPRLRSHSAASNIKRQK